LIKAGAADEQLDGLDKTAKESAKEAVEFAMKSPEPDADDLAADVYAQPWGDELLPRVE
jgi:TPP-dependent pyruvate/acetoin dehydrogenase alpha subunit